MALYDALHSHKWIAYNWMRSISTILLLVHALDAGALILQLGDQKSFSTFSGMELILESNKP